MRKGVPAAALVLGLTSYCFLLLVSKEATVRSLVTLGAMSIFIIAASLHILWNPKADKVSEPLPPANCQDPVLKNAECEMYLEISE